MRADWDTFIANLGNRLQREGRVSLTIDEVIGETRSRDRAIRARGFWRSNQRGDRDYSGFAAAGISIHLVPDRRGETVESVTFSLRA